MEKQKVQEAVRDFNWNKSDGNRKKPGRITNIFAENANKIPTLIDVNRWMKWERKEEKKKKNFGKFLKERKLVKNQI